MVNANDIYEAKNRIKNDIHKTPVLQSKEMNKISENKIFLKSEHLQKTGSFKIRGATNKVLKSIEDGEDFVTTASSGNHGQAIAFSANKNGIPATIVIPENATSSKREAIKSYNGKVIEYETESKKRIPKAMEIAKKNNGVYIPPYNDPEVISGQGTIGLELLEQLDNIDFIFVPIGGGGAYIWYIYIC